MEKILYLHPKIETVMLTISFILSLLYGFRSVKKTEESISNDSGRKNYLVLNKDIILRIIMFAIATALIIWMQWSVWNNSLVSQLIGLLMLLKGVTGMVSETATGIETVHLEVTKNNSKNLSNKGEAFLHYVCYGIMLILIACQEWLSSVITRFIGVSGHKDLIIIVITLIWYFLLLFHTSCVLGTVTKELIYCLKKFKRERKKHVNNNNIMERIDAAKPVLAICNFIAGRKRMIIRFFLYVLLVPICFCIGIVLSGILLIFNTIESISLYVKRTWTQISSSVKYVYKKTQELGEIKYIWVCFRFSIMISVIIAVGVFYKHQILQESTLQIFVFVAETLIIPFTITEIGRIKEVFGET